MKLACVLILSACLAEGRDPLVRRQHARGLLQDVEEFVGGEDYGLERGEDEVEKELGKGKGKGMSKSKSKGGGEGVCSNLSCECALAGKGKGKGKGMSKKKGVDDEAARLLRRNLFVSL